MDISYIRRILGGASFKKLASVVDKVCEKTGKNRLSVFLDILRCTKKYGAGYYDYLIFGFYELPAEKRATYVTRMISRKLNLFLNDAEYMHCFDNKDEFNEIFAKFIRRGWIRADRADKESLRAFCEGKAEIFAKIRDGECSHGVERIRMADWPDFDALYEHIKSCGYGLIEDVVDQHPDLEALHPGSVNCMRIITLLDDSGEPHCLYAVQKIGMGDSFVDCNCMFAPVDVETGVIKYPAHSGETPLGIIYNEHPDSHITIPGYRLPFVPQAVAMCLEAARIVPQVRYVGWDVAISRDGPEFIEGNTYCAHDFWQLPVHTPDRIGMLPVFRKYAAGLKDVL